MNTLTVCNVKGEKVGQVTLPAQLLVTDKGAQAVHDVVVAHRAKLHRGTAATKTRAHVSGGGIKPFKQKGTGRARAGSIRSPIWRGGGTVFGPHPRSYAKKVNQKTAQLAFRRAFSERVAAGDVVVVEQVSLAEPKSKALMTLLRQLKVETGALVLVQNLDRNLRLAARNLVKAEVVTVQQASVYQVLRYPKVVISQEALAGLEQRLQP